MSKISKLLYDLNIRRIVLSMVFYSRVRVLLFFYVTLLGFNVVHALNNPGIDGEFIELHDLRTLREAISSCVSKLSILEERVYQSIILHQLHSSLNYLRGCLNTATELITSYERTNDHSYVNELIDLFFTSYQSDNNFLFGNTSDLNIVPNRDLIEEIHTMNSVVIKMVDRGRGMYDGFSSEMFLISSTVIHMIKSELTTLAHVLYKLTFLDVNINIEEVMKTMFYLREECVIKLLLKFHDENVCYAPNNTCHTCHVTDENEFIYLKNDCNAILCHLCFVRMAYIDREAER